MPTQCTYCGTRLHKRRQSASGFSIDHVIPRARLSRSKVTITDAQRSMNRVPCCVACNNRKDDMDPRDWLAHIHDTQRRKAFENLLQLLPITLIYGR